MKRTPQIVSRTASVGLVTVLLLLAAVSFWATTTTQRVITRVTQASQDAALYQQAGTAAQKESSEQLEYLTSRNPSHRVQFYLASDSLVRALRELQRTGDGDSASARSLLAEHQRYLSVFGELLAAIRAGTQDRTTTAYTNRIEALSMDLVNAISAAASRDRQADARSMTSLAGSTNLIGTAVVITFGIGIFLLILCWWVLRSTGQALVEAEATHRTLVEQLPVAAYRSRLDAAGSILYIGQQIEVMLGYTRFEWMSNPELWVNVIYPEDQQRVLAEYIHHVDSAERFVSEYRMVARDGRIIWVRDEAVVVKRAANQPRVRHGVFSDITERKQAEADLQHQALHDDLTRLPNRTLLQDRLDQGMLTAQRNHTSLALLLMDLDSFKDVNDTLGHQYGDALLQEAGHRLRETLRESDTVARLGGDEFAVLLPSSNIVGATMAARKIVRSLKTPFEIEGQMVHVGASIGIVLFPDHGQNANTLLQRADVAMYTAKRGDGGFVVYESDQDPYSPARLALMSDLREAIDTGGLALHYQPKAHVRTGCTEHVEALLRWEHPEKGFIPPDQFIPLAEHAGLMKSLSSWVLNEALRQCHLWHEEGCDISVAVNLSARNLHDTELVEAVEELLDRWSLEPAWLQLEITEGALMIDPIRAMATLTRLHEMGVWISIDDFGTGYSSLGYLKRLPAHQLKIDKSFVLEMATNEDDAFIVRSVIDLAHSLGLEVVAEGVENQQTWDLLAAMGCDLAQGYHLSRPLTPKQLDHWLQGESSRQSLAG
jgi:diguanylate cyclase (GGDEF)-like protein/PAS domain S-box-containing protein